MIDSEILDKYQQPLPVSFKVIGIGEGVTDIIEKVKSFGYDCVGCFIANTPSDCTPMDDDKMVIIVARDNEDVANAIAKAYHDAGVLTIGLLYDAAPDCFDSVETDASPEKYADIIRALLQPIVTQGYICYDFNDLCTTLRDTHFFTALTAEGQYIENAVTDMKKLMNNIALKGIEYLSAHLYFNNQRLSDIKIEDLSPLTDMMSNLQESVTVIWSVNFDDTLPTDTIRFTTVMSGKGLI